MPLMTALPAKYANSQILKAIQVPVGARPNAIVIEPASGTALPQARAACAAGIGWAVLNRAPDISELRRTSTAPIFSVSSDHFEIGRIQGRQFASKRRLRSLCFLSGLQANHEMAQRSNPALSKTRNRKQSLKTGLLMGKRAQRIPSWPGVINSNKGRIHLRRPTCHAHFLLATERRTIHSGLRVPIGTGPDDPSGNRAAQFSIGKTYAEAAHTAENSGDDEPQNRPEETERHGGV
jgi:hypothetical protein